MTDQQWEIDPGDDAQRVPEYHAGARLYTENMGKFVSTHEKKQMKIIAANAILIWGKSEKKERIEIKINKTMVCISDITAGEFSILIPPQETAELLSYTGVEAGKALELMEDLVKSVRGGSLC